MAIAPEGGFRIADYPWATDIAIDPASKDYVHVDNVRIAALFNDARARFQSLLIDRCGGDGFTEQVIARIALDFVAELAWRPTVRIAAGIERIGNSSYSIGMLLGMDGKVFARCVTTNVWVRDGRPRPITAGARAVLASFSLEAVA